MGAQSAWLLAEERLQEPCPFLGLRSDDKFGNIEIVVVLWRKFDSLYSDTSFFKTVIAVTGA